ncbi:MAG: tetratricopeptide repeat protein, partial [Myxococcales bacterium]|nr:tetratricopeptide repeat protein [Myxococcales bacterium]
AALAALHHQAGNLERAEACYRNVLGVLPQHEAALEALAAIYDAAGRDREYVEIRSRLVDLQAPSAPPAEREAMIRGLARDLDTRLRRPAEAIRRLEPLARELPERVDIQEELADLLRRQGEHAAAATVLRGALEHAAGDDRLRVLAALGGLEERLGADEAAIERWQGILAARDGDPDALAHLQALYLKGHRWDALLEVIERRLAAVGDDRDLRIAILVDKARALLEGFNDEAAATSTLEALAAEDPDNDAVILGLCDLYRRSGRTAEAQARLHARLRELPAEALGPRAKIALALAGLLEKELGDLEEAMATIEAALGDDAGNRDLLAARAHLARRTDDAPVLVDTLERLGDTDGLLEAAELAREALRDPDWSARLYSAILRGADKSSDDPRTSALLATALAGLARLRLDAGDREGVDALVGDWVTQIPTAGLQARVLTELGRALWKATADLELARPRFDAAKAADPDYALATHRLGEVLLLAGRYDEAEPLLEDAVESHVLSRDQGHLIDGLLLLAQLFEATDRSADAYRRLSSALRQDPSSLEIRAAIVRNRHQAGRWKEAIAAVEKVDEQLAAGKVLSQGDRRRLAEMLVLASAAAAEQGDPDQELELFERAVKADPDNLEILDRLIARCRERGLQDRQARHTAARAEHLSDPVERGKTLLEAGMLAAAAAAAIEEAAEAEGRDPTDDERLEIDDLRDRAFVALRKGIALVIHEPTPVVERRQLEVAFWVSASRDTETALGCLDRLLLRDDLRRESRLELLLEGVRLALERRQGGDLERARVYAKAACDGFPERASPIAAMFDVLEASGGDDAQEDVERLVLMFFNRQGLRSTQGEAEDARRSALLIRLADTQHEHPERAIRLLEKAATLDTRGLGVAERRHLSRLYLAAGADAKRIRRNYEAILELDPVDTANIRALFDLCVAAEDLDQAAALAALLRVLDPGDATVEALAARFGVEVGERDGFDINGIIPAEPASGGMIPAMRQLWRGGAAILCAKLPRLDTEGATLPESDDPFFTTWSDTQARIGAPPYPLVDAAAVAADVEGGWLIPHCQYPPVMVVGPKAKYEEASAHLRFAIGRSLFFARPGNLLTAALEQEQLVTVLAATLLAFHPRHAHRRDYIRDDDEATHQLAQHLSRKLPLKVSRAIAGLFQEHASEAFDSRDWRAWVERGGNRLGLCAAGDLEIALEILGVPSEPEARAEALRERVADDVILHDLLGFAGSARFAKARRGLGYTATLDPSAGPLPVLAPTSTPAEPADDDAPPVAAEATEEEAAPVETIADLEGVSDAEELLGAEDFPDAEEFLDAEDFPDAEEFTYADELVEPDVGADANEDVDTGVETDDDEDLDTSATPVDRSTDDGEASSPEPRLEAAPADSDDADDLDTQGV